jgi:hypothetical protein
MGLAGHHVPTWFDEAVGPDDGDVSVWNSATGRFESAPVVGGAVPNGTYVGNAERAALLDSILTGTITRDSNGAATAATATWPDGATGAYSALVVSSAFPGAVDSYNVTHVLGGTTITYTQPTVTRDANGAVTTRPAITVA